MKQLTFADGIIRLGGEELPGIFVALRVDGKVRYDNQKVDGASGKKKTPQGWEDHVIVASLVLVTDNGTDCYEKLEIIAPLFQKPDAKANPQVLDVVNRHLQARGIRQVVFDRLESSENDQTDEIFVTLGFTEHNPPIVRAESSAAKTPTPREMQEQAEQAGKDAPKEEPELVIDAG